VRFRLKLNLEGGKSNTLRSGIAAHTITGERKIITEHNQNIKNSKLPRKHTNKKKKKPWNRESQRVPNLFPEEKRGHTSIRDHCSRRKGVGFFNFPEERDLFAAPKGTGSGKEGKKV